MKLFRNRWGALHQNRRLRGRVLATAAFLVLFLILLAPAPLSGAIWGSVDTLFIPALGDTVANRIYSSLTGEFVGQSLYPANVLRYGETAFGTGAIFLVFHFLGAADVLAVYLTQVLLLTSMALATLVLAETLTASFPAGLLAALVFTTSNFVWADIDHLPIHFYFFPLLSLAYLIRAVNEVSVRHLLLAGILGGLQAYFSLQVYAYQCILLGIFCALHLRTLARLPLKRTMLAAAVYLIVALPLVAYYVDTALRLTPVDAWPRSSNEQIYSLQLTDLATRLPGKLIDYPFTRESAGGWTQVAHSAFPGLLAPFLAVAGLRQMDSRKWGILAFGLIALFLALGNSIEVAGLSVTSPLALLYEHVPIARYLRVGIRAYSIALLCMSLLLAYGWHWLQTWLENHWRGIAHLVLPVACAVVAAENVSWPVNRFEILPYPQIPVSYEEYFRDKPDALILDLPSHSTSWPSYIDDIVYMLWQTYHRRNILGGVNGYYPPTRIETQRYTDKLPGDSAFRYFRRMGATHFVWHKSPFLVCHPRHSEFGCDPVTGQRSALEARGPSWLDSTPWLRLVFEDESVKIYELK